MEEGQPALGGRWVIFRVPSNPNHATTPQTKKAFVVLPPHPSKQSEGCCENDGFFFLPLPALPPISCSPRQESSLPSTHHTLQALLTSNLPPLQAIFSQLPTIPAALSWITIHHPTENICY